MKSKKLSLVIALLMLQGAFAACSNGTKDPGNTGDPVSDTEKADYFKDTLGERDFGGAVFNIAAAEGAGVPLDSENGEIVNDALFKRNSKLMSDYNVNIVNNIFSAEGDSAALTDAIINNVLADDDGYDLVIGPLATTMRRGALNKVLYDMTELPTVDFTNPWWSEYAYENMQIGGKLFFTTGDITSNYFYVPIVMAFNMRLADDNKLDIFDMVRSGEWTLDKFDEITKDYTIDLNGDGEITTDDRIAYAHVRTEIISYSHYIAAGQKMSTVDKDGNIHVELDSEPSIDILQKLASIFTRLENKAITNNDTAPMFKNGQALFYSNSLASVVNNFRDMKDDYGIIPLPKADKEQDSYYTAVNTWTRGYIGVPANTRDTELTGFMMEAMACLSYDMVRPVVYDKVLEGKISRTDDSVDMLDIIFSTIYIDSNYVFNLGGSGTEILRTVMYDEDFMSSYAAIKDAIQADIDELNHWFD
ncbi:MAG: extracellular solute-binding protein [Clostridiales bacterium]|nr:extracellular solute-binding protein [Clostridiales bacterium]